ncbi:YcnI family protein [Streptomyces sp.]|uniref:YcnI family copper-binding membrane protein n=1 Tax=Streptomyces sp. TaxID=1931 RepID=UPI002F3E79FE
MSSSRTRGRAATVAALAGSAVLLGAVPALAHVSVQPGTAPKGGYSTVAFKVPNEQDDASTVKVEVHLPTGHPIASVSLQPVPGWTAQVSTAKLSPPLKTDDGTVDQAVTKITWSGGKIAPGQFQQFPVSFGPLPDDTDELVFKALQTYDNGDVVRWIEVPRAGRSEPENPAPVLTLTAAASDHGHAGTPEPAPAPGADDGTGAQDDEARTASATSVGITDSSDDTARALGAAGIAVGALGVAFGVFAGRRRKPSGGSAGGSSDSSAGGSSHPSA